MITSKGNSLFSIANALVIFAFILSVSQLIWVYNGADRAFLYAPRWITIVRGIAVILLIVVLLLPKSRVFETHFTFNLEIWMIILASYIFIRGFYLEAGIPKITSFSSYVVLGLLIFNIKRRTTTAAAIQYPLRVLVYGSLLEALLLPHFAFSDSPSRFGVFFQFNRFCGLVSHPSLFAAIAFLYLVSVISVKSKFWKIEFLIIVILLLYANTASVLICLPLLYFMESRGKFQVNSLRLLGIAAPMVSIFVLFRTLSQEITISAIMGSDALNARPVIWDWAFDTWLQSPELGLSSESQNYSLKYSKTFYWAHAHNQILQDLLTGGFLRLLIVFIIYFKLLQLALLRLREGHPQSIVVYILLISQSTFEIPFTLNTIDFRFLTFLVLLLFNFVNFQRYTKLTGV